MNRIIQNTILVGFKMWKKVSTDSPEKAVEHIKNRNICTDMEIPASIELAYDMNGISEVLKAI